MIISVINQKGGTGKTTIAINLTAMISKKQEKQSRVLLVDADPQETSSDWAASRDISPPFDLIQLSKPVLHRDLENMKENYTHIIIDCPPRSYEVARSAIMASDIVLIPVQPSGADIWASKEIIELVNECKSFKENQKAAFLISRKISGTAIGRDIREALAGLGLPVFESCTSQRIAFVESLTAGKTIYEYEPKGQAAKEITAIGAELLTL